MRAARAILAGIGAAVGVRVLARRRRDPIDRSGLRVVRDAADDATEIDDATGAVRSVQSAEVELPTQTLDALWSPLYLERLARTYWSYLTRATLGLVRVYYDEHERRVCLLVRPLSLLTFTAPSYELDPSRAIVRWGIDRGLLVARRAHGGRGFLEIDVRRRPAPGDGAVLVSVEVEVAEFHPALASRFGRWLYAQTQSRVHVLLTRGFLRSLARLDLEPSVVRRFEPAPARDAAQP